MPTYDRVHLKSCLADAVRSAVENLRDDPEVSHLAFHTVINGGSYQGLTLYSLAYTYLEDGLVRCQCSAVPGASGSTERKVPREIEVLIDDIKPGDIIPSWVPGADATVVSVGVWESAVVVRVEDDIRRRWYYKGATITVKRWV